MTELSTLRPSVGWFQPKVFVLAAWLLVFTLPDRTRGEDHVDYRYEDYREKDDRIHVQTHGLLFETTLKQDLLEVKGELVYDALSGATPNGAAPPAKYNYDFGFPVPILGDTNKTTVPLSHMEDERIAFSVETPVTLGQHRVSPQFAYSDESDYTSYGAALSYSIELNEKNTTPTVGWSHTWDSVRDDRGQYQDKSTDDFLVGVNQLLGPKTVVGLNLTYGLANGYLNDPYRFIVAANDPQLDADNPAGRPEQRPDDRQKFIMRASITQFITPCNASMEGAYRYYQDTWDISAHTVELAWYQKIGKHVILSPNFRYYYQTAADFYYEMLPDSNNPPPYYSPDYRLSEMQTFTVGANLVVKATKWLSFDATYKRYIMEGLDGVTSQSAYPTANVFTIGARVFF